MRDTIISRETASSSFASSNHSDSCSKGNPLISIIGFVMENIDDGQVDSALDYLASSHNSTVYEIVKNYRFVITWLRMLSKQKISESLPVSSECKNCQKEFQLPMDMYYLAFFPVCFDCQEEWADYFEKAYMKN